MKNITYQKCSMTDKSDSSEITDLSSTKLLKSVNNENKLPTISPYILEHKHKDRNDSAAKVQANLASTGFHPHKPQVSPKATFSSALPGHHRNKRSFDVAFLAGTRGRGSDNKITMNKNCDELNKASSDEDTGNLAASKLQVNPILINSGTKSAFRKFHQQLSTQLGVLKENEVENTKYSPTYNNIAITNKQETDTNQNNKRSDNITSPSVVKDNELDCSIDPKGGIPSTESRDCVNNNGREENKHSFTRYKTEQQIKKGSTKETEIVRAGDLTMPSMKQDALPRRTLPLPPKLTSIPQTLLQQHQTNLSSSSISNTNADLTQSSPSSSPFNLLQFPALKKFIDVQSAQRKCTAPHLSAFSSIKSKQDDPRPSAPHSHLQHPPVLSRPALMFPSAPPSPQFTPFHPPIGMASFMGSPLLPPSPAAVVAAANSARNVGAGAGPTGGSFVPSNTCAKCGVTFRMTSDLVYHMRTHHAKETAETSYEKRRHVDSLTCNVCGENFRERHHLTRHMTAHVARKGEPEDKSNSDTSRLAPTSTQRKSYIQQEVVAFANNLPELPSSRTSAASADDTTPKLL